MATPLARVLGRYAAAAYKKSSSKQLCASQYGNMVAPGSHEHHAGGPIQRSERHLEAPAQQLLEGHHPIQKRVIGHLQDVPEGQLVDRSQKCVRFHAGRLPAGRRGAVRPLLFKVGPDGIRARSGSFSGAPLLPRGRVVLDVSVVLGGWRWGCGVWLQ